MKRPNTHYTQFSILILIADKQRNTWELTATQSKRPCRRQSSFSKEVAGPLPP